MFQVDIIRLRSVGVCVDVISGELASVYSC